MIDQNVSKFSFFYVNRKFKKFAKISKKINRDALYNTLNFFEHQQFCNFVSCRIKCLKLSLNLIWNILTEIYLRLSKFRLNSINLFHDHYQIHWIFNNTFNEIILNSSNFRKTSFSTWNKIKINSQWTLNFRLIRIFYVNYFHVNQN